MPLIEYVSKNFGERSLEVIDSANEIIEEYEEQGFDLTLRQLYYQFVSRDLLENTAKAYNRLGCIINDARLAGKIDWQAIVDRTRYLRTLAHWNNPQRLITDAANQYRIDKWAWQKQPSYIEVWIEKDALVGVIEGICNTWDVPFFSCRGYISQSEMWAASQRLLSKQANGKTCHIIHLGDHDPSGIDMTRDIQDRLNLFNAEVQVERIALNMDQIKQYNPPPNPAKITDSRSKSYIDIYGESSWELDALNPQDMVDLVESEIKKYLILSEWEDAREREEEEKNGIHYLADNFNRLIEGVSFIEGAEDENE